MKTFRPLAALFLMACLTGVAYVAQLAEPAGAKMTSAAEKLVASLSAEQQTKGLFGFDDKERTNWHFIPMNDKNKKTTRKGVSLEDMSAEQKASAISLIKSGTSASGFTQATTIMSLEAIVRDLEKEGAMVRNPEWYFFSIFGKPSRTEKWGWRVEGHHLSLNFVVDQGKVVAETPFFFGANPATVKAGPRKGFRALPEAEDLAKELLGALDDEQKKVAYFQKPFEEVEQAKPSPNVGEPKGLSYAKMNEKQRALLMKLLESYTRRMPDDLAALEMDQLKAAGFDKILYAYAGGVEAGTPYTYRIQGPTFVVEFLNVQADSSGNQANHIHSVWRNLKGDFGLTK